MKLISIFTIISHILSFAFADLSCINNQIDVEDTGINQIDTDDIDIFEDCDIEYSPAVKVECNYGDIGVTIDSDECTKAGGRDRQS